MNPISRPHLNPKLFNMAWQSSTWWQVFGVLAGLRILGAWTTPIMDCDEVRGFGTTPHSPHCPHRDDSHDTTQHPRRCSDSIAPRTLVASYP